MKRLYFLYPLLAIAIFCSCSKDIIEETITGSISGSVSDRTTGEPVATVNVSINPGGSSTVTGSDGTFSFPNLYEGSYTLSIRKEGYKSNTITAEVKAGKPTSLHMTIDRIPASLTADKNLLDFGESLVTLSFTIVNSGYTDLAYKVETGHCPWLSVEPETDILGYGKTATIVVNLDRSKLPEGKNEANIVVRSTSGNGNVEVKVVAVNNAGASVNTLDVTNVANTTATLNGEIINPGSPTYTERGFVYDTQSTPTVSNCIRKLSSPVTSDKKFFCSIDGLSPTQTYYARTYIVQNGNTIYGNTVSFTTSQQTTTLSTSAVTQIGASTATFNAQILTIGTPAYTERGFCYSKSNTPTIADNRKPVSGSGAGNFSLSVTNLEYPVTYYVRAYAIQGGKTIYGNIVSFATEFQQVSVKTYAATEITSSSAVLNGNISQVGSPAYTEKGFCYGSYDPTIHRDSRIVVSGSGTGNFSVRIANLDPDKMYYVRAYSIQEGEVVYGENVYFYTNYTKAVVNTSDVTNIAYTSATFNGSITNIGDPKISERGFCYTDNGYDNPRITDKKIKVNGIASGDFKAEMTNLEEGNLYYVRAYAIQDGEAIYGTAKRFETGYTPVVVIGSPSAASTSYYWNATFRGIFADGNPEVIEAGFVYNTTSNPTVNTGTTVQASSVKWSSLYEGYEFNRTVSTLLPYNTYYARAYVKTRLGYTYSETVSFTTY